MSVTALPGFSDEPTTLAAAVRIAATLSPAEAVPALLELLLESTGADALALAGPEGTVHRGSAVTLAGSGREHPLVRSGRPLGVLTLHGGRDLPSVTEVVADLLALLLAPDAALVAAVLTETEADLDAVAGLLHDGPAQDAVAARYAAVLVGRGLAPAEDLAAAADSVGSALRTVVTGLRSRGGDGDLAGALRAGAARRDGVTLDAAADLPATSPAVTALASRLLDAAVLPAGGAVTLLPTSDGALAAVVTGLLPGHAAAVADRFLARTRALDLQVAPEHTALRLRLPAAGPSRKDKP